MKLAKGNFAVLGGGLPGRWNETGKMPVPPTGCKPVSLCLFWGGFFEGSDGEEDGGADDAGVGNVEGWPRVGEGDVEVEAEEVDDMTVDDAVGEVATDTGGEKGDGEPADGAGEHAFAIEDRDQHQGSEGDGAEDVVGVGAAVEVAKSDAGVVDVVQGEEVGNDFFTGSAQRIFVRGPVFGDLIDDVERKAQ